MASVPVEAKGLKFPNACPKCMQPATKHIAVEKEFPRDEGEPKIVAFYPLVCSACAKTHHNELPRHGVDLLFRRLWHGGGLTAGAVANGAFGLFLTPKLLPQVFTSEWGFIGLVPLAFFYGLSAACFSAAMSQTRHLACPPPTSISGSVDFTDDESDTFEPSWHRLTFENAAYAELFRTTNAERIWSKRSEKAQKAAARRSMLKICAWIAVAGVVAYGLYEEMHDSVEGVLRGLRVID